MKIIKPDQHLASYVYEKQVNPEAKIVLRAFERKKVEAVDRIVELAHGERDFVSSQSDWAVVEELLNFWATEWPEEYIDFKASIPQIRSSRRSGGYSESKEIKYVGAIPPRFNNMMKVIFPAQQWDKKFVNKLVKKFPGLKIGGEQNLS